MQLLFYRVGHPSPYPSPSRGEGTSVILNLFQNDIKKPALLPSSPPALRNLCYKILQFSVPLLKFFTSSAVMYDIGNKRLKGLPLWVWQLLKPDS